MLLVKIPPVHGNFRCELNARCVTNKDKKVTRSSNQNILIRSYCNIFNIDPNEIRFLMFLPNDMLLCLYLSFSTCHKLIKKWKVFG